MVTTSVYVLWTVQTVEYPISLRDRCRSSLSLSLITADHNHDLSVVLKWSLTTADTLTMQPVLVDGLTADEAIEAYWACYEPLYRAALATVRTPKCVVAATPTEEPCLASPIDHPTASQR